MGSSFSIYNDTGDNIYVWNGVQWDYVALGLGIGLAGGAVLAAPISATTGAVVGGAGAITSQGISVGTSNADQERLAAINAFKSNCDQKLAPGQTYTYNGSLSLTRSVYLMREDGSTSSRGCWTGATDKSDIRYNVSRDWSW